VKEEKAQLREKIWRIMEEKKIARFPLPPYDRIPNFEGSDKAAEKVRELEVYRKAKIVVANPDYAQKKVREYALKDGKILIVASPRLKHGYLQINPEKVRGKEEFASTIEGCFKYGKRIKEIPKPDLIVTGCVAVDKNGNRLGKGKGYGDREINFFKSKFGEIPVLTTVHEIQIVEKVPVEENDAKVDFIVTPKRIIECRLHDK
jgi:5-formyltetrahydrofolate cyclo-ligase